MSTHTETVRSRAEKAVYGAIDGLNEMLPLAQTLQKAPETPLLGRAGKLDSTGFINLIVLLEEKCEEEFGISVSLSDGHGPEKNPFENIAMLIQYMTSIVEGKLR